MPEDPRLHILKKLLFDYASNQTLAEKWLAAIDAVDPLRQKSGGPKAHGRFTARGEPIR